MFVVRNTNFIIKIEGTLGQSSPYFLTPVKHHPLNVAF